MAQLGQTFDATQHDPAGEGFELIPAGEYPVMIVKSEMKPTKAGTGQYLELEMDLQDGSSRKVWDRLNLINPNPKAVEIAQRSLSAICHATGQMSVQDSEQLHGRLMVAVIKVEPGQGAYGPSNGVKTYKPANAGGVAPTPQAAAPTQTQAAPASAPWQR